MKGMILAVLLASVLAAGCNAQEGFYPTAPENTPEYTATVHDSTWVDLLFVVRDIVDSAWQQTNDKYICYINEYGFGEAYHLRASNDFDGGLVLIYNYRNDGQLYPRTCYEGVLADGSSVAVGSCTNRRIFLDQITFIADQYDQWYLTHYQLRDGWQQWNIRLTTGESLYFALPTVDALVFPCEKPPYWVAPEPKTPTKRDVHDGQ